MPGLPSVAFLFGFPHAQPLVYHPRIKVTPELKPRRASARSVALGGVCVAYRVDFFAHAAPHDDCCRRLACGSLMLAPGSVSAEGLFDFLFGGAQKQQQAGPRRRNFFADPFGLNQQPPTPHRHRASRLRTRLLRAQLRRQVFSADHARQCLAGPDLPGVLPGQRHQGFFGSNIDGATAAMASAMPTAKTPMPIARRCAPTAPATAAARPASRRSISRSTPRCARATCRHHRRPGGLYRRPARRQARPPNSPRSPPIPASPPMSAPGSAK